jgi:hypothetical protein
MEWALLLVLYQEELALQLDQLEKLESTHLEQVEKLESMHLHR